MMRLSVRCDPFRAYGIGSSHVRASGSLGIWVDGVSCDCVDCLNTVEGELVDVAGVSAGSDATGLACVEVPTGAESSLIYFEDIWALDGT
jgi:hypothetical protein